MKGCWLLARTIHFYFKRCCDSCEQLAVLVQARLSDDSPLSRCMIAT